MKTGLQLITTNKVQVLIECTFWELLTLIVHFNIILVMLAKQEGYIHIKIIVWKLKNIKTYIGKLVKIKCS